MFLFLSLRSPFNTNVSYVTTSGSVYPTTVTGGGNGALQSAHSTSSAAAAAAAAAVPSAFDRRSVEMFSAAAAGNGLLPSLLSFENNGVSDFNRNMRYPHY